MVRSRLSTRKKLIGLVVVVTLSILSLEGIARFYFRDANRVNAYYLEVNSGFSDLDALIEDIQSISGLKYYDEFLYAAPPTSTDHINFTDYYSARWTPDSIAITEAEYIVWTFGGSTMENTETTDRLTIANTLSKRLNESLGPTHVKNFGTGGFFSSYELIKFQSLLRKVPEDEFPDVAIFYDGYNDSLFGFQYGPGSLQKDLSLKLQSLIEHKELSIAIYTASEWISKYSVFWDRSAARLIEYWLYRLPEPDTSSKNLIGSVRVYIRNVKMIKATCDEFQIHCLFILQPLIVTKKPLSELEQEVLNNMEKHPRFGSEGARFIREFYNLVNEELTGDKQFINASHILDGRVHSDFYDLGHTGAQTSPIIGENIAQMVLSRINSR